MRPQGSYGPVGQALLVAARSGPGTVVQLAQRAQVGVKCARYTATRLCAAGELQVLQEGRPAVLAAASVGAASAAVEGGGYEDLVMLDAAYWARPAGVGMG